MIGLGELIAPAIIIVAIIIFYKIFKHKSNDVAKNIGKEAENFKKIVKEIPQSFREGMEEAKESNENKSKEKSK